jgi:hypothetical protein
VNSQRPDRSSELLLERRSARAAERAPIEPNAEGGAKLRKHNHRDQVWWLMIAAFAMMGLAFFFVVWASRAIA